MKKIFLMLFAIGALGLGFSSCSSDDDEPEKPDLTMKDLSTLRGEYSGDCTIEITNRSIAPVKEANSMVELSSTSNAAILALKTKQFGNIITGDMVRNFKYTAVDKKESTFTVGAFTTEKLVGGDIPAYIKEWFGNGATYDEITRVDRTLESTTATFTDATKTLKFEYKGTIEVYAISKGAVVGPDKYSISYTYNVVKK